MRGLASLRSSTERPPSSHRYWVVFCVLVVALCLTAILALCVGRYYVSPADVINCFLSYVMPDVEVSEQARSVVELLRLPRVIAAMLVGAALALAGATYQSLFQNPLVSPDLLGVSSGACVGAAIAIICGMQVFGVQMLAFGGGVIAVGIAVLIPRLMRSRNMMTLVLSGVIVSGFMGSIVGLLEYLADTETQLPDIVYWQLGSLTKVEMSDIGTIGILMLVSGAVLIALSWRMNLLSLGERESASLGVDVRFERGLCILCATLITASAVCLSGTIGWLGLVVPHLSRKLVGSDNTRVLPVSALLSAVFLLIIDTLARTMTGSEIPLSILTGIVGAPFFAFILMRNRKTGPR